MAAPTIRSSTGGGSASTASFSLPLPATVVSGDILVCACGVKGSGNTYTFPAGWTVTNSGLTNGQAIATKVATGTEGGTSITVTSSSSAGVAYASWAVANANSTIAKSQNSGSLTPPSLTSGFGSVDTLWLTGLFGSTTTAGPIGYSGYMVWTTAGATYCSTANTATTAASESPGAFSGSSASSSSAFTIALSAGSVTTNSVLPGILGANF